MSNKFKNMKIKTNGREHVSKVVFALLELGYKQANGSSDYFNGEVKWFFTDERNGMIKLSFNDKFGQGHSHPTYFLSAMDEFLPRIQTPQFEVKPCAHAYAAEHIKTEAERLRPLIEQIVREQMAHLKLIYDK